MSDTSGGIWGALAANSGSKDPNQHGHSHPGEGIEDIMLFDQNDRDGGDHGQGKEEKSPFGDIAPRENRGQSRVGDMKGGKAIVGSIKGEDKLGQPFKGTMGVNNFRPPDHLDRKQKKNQIANRGHPEIGPNHLFENFPIWDYPIEEKDRQIDQPITEDKRGQEWNFSLKRESNHVKNPAVLIESIERGIAEDKIAHQQNKQPSLLPDISLKFHGEWEYVIASGMTTEIQPIDPKEGYRPENDPNCITCLNYGFVRLVEVMGSDHSVVQAARVSYGKGTKSLRADRALIHYLLQHKHTTPFEMIEFKFHCRMPIFVARQWIRHRTANVNEVSGRYSIMEEMFWEPTPEDIRKQSFTNRQGSTNEAVTPATAEKICKEFIAEQKKLYQQYEGYLKEGMAREVARANLPLSLYTEWYWKIDLHNLLHFLQLRMDAHAQQEIRVFACAMAEFVKRHCPIVWEAFEEHQLHAAQFSASERKLLAELIEKNGLWKEIEQKRTAQLKADEATDKKIERELENLRNRLLT